VRVLTWIPVAEAWPLRGALVLGYWSSADWHPVAVTRLAAVDREGDAHWTRHPLPGSRRGRLLRRAVALDPDPGGTVSDVEQEMGDRLTATASKLLGDLTDVPHEAMMGAYVTELVRLETRQRALARSVLDYVQSHNAVRNGRYADVSAAGERYAAAHEAITAIAEGRDLP
jgi:hypothetical protein